MSEENREIDFFEVDGQRYKTTMYSVEKAYDIQEILIDAASDPLANLINAFKGADDDTLEKASTAAKGMDMSALKSLSEETDDLNEAEIANAIASLIRSIRRNGGFFKVMDLILSDTKQVDDKGRAKSINYAVMKSRRVELENVMIHVVLFNFKDYFFTRVAQIGGGLGDSLAKAAAKTKASEPE